MGIYVGTSEPKSIYIGTTPVKEVYVGTTKVRPKARTFTISWTEQSDMSYGWTYSDDATGMTAGSGDFDDFFGYSAVLLNTSGVETAEMTQSGGEFSGKMSSLGNISGGDNVMIKFPLRGIKMTKSGKVVTLSITDGLGRESEGYQYYAHCTGTLTNPGTPKDAFYLGAYLGYNNTNVLKSWSGLTPTASLNQSYFCTLAKANGSGYNIEGFYQRMYINALYMMKYGNPNSQSVVGMGYVTGSSAQPTGGRNNNTAATIGTTSSQVQVKLFGLEDRWGNLSEFVGGAYFNNSSVLYTRLSGWAGSTSGGETTGTTIPTFSYDNLAAIVGDNKAMFAPLATTRDTGHTTYYADSITGTISGYYTLASAGGGYYNQSAYAGAFRLDMNYYTSTNNAQTGARLQYL